MTSLPHGFSTDSPDIRERAERLAKTIERAALFTRGSEAWLDPSKSADLISQALTAEREAGRAEERERAAKLAEEMRRDHKRRAKRLEALTAPGMADSAIFHDGYATAAGDIAAMLSKAKTE